MCEFCISHGDTKTEGGRWYDNMSNYSRKAFERVNTEAGLRKFLAGFKNSLGSNVELAHKTRERIPRIYDLIINPLVTRHLKRTHFGQVVPLADMEALIGRFDNLVRLPCICRRVSTGHERRYCLGIGMDLTHIYDELPDFRDYDVIESAEAGQLVRKLSGQGSFHSVWTFMTPFIGAVCNCDRDCMAYRFQHDMGLGRAMWKAEYIAQSDNSLCNSCGQCEEVCYFNALKLDSKDEKCSIDARKCYGCGLCETVCETGAIRLATRVQINSF